MPYLMHGGADNVDTALVTHLHADHYKGISELAEIFPVGAIGIPADYKDSYSEIMSSGDPAQNISTGRKQRVFFIFPDTKINITDDVYIETIWPAEVSDEPIAADDPNEHNTVYMVHYKDIKIMVTGDLLEADEQQMVEYYRDTDILECDILKVAHHGSKSSSSEAFLDAARPRIAVIQCGFNNFYGHPHMQTLERLESRGIRTFRTDLSGAVGIDIHGSRISVDLFKDKKL
jgi:competence protein ComEC